MITQVKIDISSSDGTRQYITTVLDTEQDSLDDKIKKIGNVMSELLRKVIDEDAVIMGIGKIPGINKFRMETEEGKPSRWVNVIK